MNPVAVGLPWRIAFGQHLRPSVPRARKTNGAASISVEAAPFVG